MDEDDDFLAMTMTTSSAELWDPVKNVWTELPP
eukprot:COSAG01_NODE_14225_length_1480_cov_14.253440_2_plen_32_part_01